MRQSLLLTWIALTTTCLWGCGREKVPDVQPDSLELTLSAASINADDGSITATALVTQLGVTLEGLTVTFELTDAAQASSTLTDKSDADGVATVTFDEIRVAGASQVLARIGSSPTDTQTFTVEPGAPTSLDLELTSPLDPNDNLEPVVAGNDLGFATTLFDAWSNVTTGAVTITTTSPAGTIDTAAITALTAAGDFDVTAELTSDSAINDTELFSVIPAAAFTAVINVSQATVEAGDGLLFECYVHDQFGNLRDDVFTTNDVNTTATTFAGGSPTVTKDMDLPGGGTQFTLGDAAAPLNVLAAAADLTCEGASFGGTVTDATDQFAVVDTTAPNNVTIALMAPNTPVRPDNALAPGEMATIRVMGDDIVGIDHIQFDVTAGDPAMPATQTFTFGAPAPGTSMNDFAITVNVTADTFDQVRVSAVVEDTSGNQTNTGALRHPIDKVADRTPVANTFFVRTHARSADFATATGLAIDLGTNTLYYVAPGAAGTDLFEVAAAGDTVGNAIATDMGGAGSTHTRGLVYSADFSGAQDIFFPRIGAMTDRTLHGVDVGMGADATFSNDPDGDADNTPLFPLIDGADLYYILQNTNAMTPSVTVRQVDNMGAGALFSDITALTATPRGITIDSNGNLYVVDNSDGDIAMIDAMGAAADVGVTLNPVTGDAATTITTAAGNFDDDLLITNDAGQLHKVDVAGQAVMDICGNAGTGFFNTAVDIVFDANFTTDIDGDGAADMNVPTALILDPGDQVIYRVHGF